LLVIALKLHDQSEAKCRKSGGVAGSGARRPGEQSAENNKI
jgi:hypothetical protein